MRLPGGSIRVQLWSGTVALLAVAACLGQAGAAYAQEGGADLRVEIASSTVVKDAGKLLVVHLTNGGPETATGIQLTIDASGLDQQKLEVHLPGGGVSCSPDGPQKVRCNVSDVPPGGNDNGIDFGFRNVFIQSIGGTGAAGSLAVSVAAQTPDPNLANNSATTSVSVVESGIDMVAWAQDAYATADDKKPIQPGKTGEFQWMLSNFGANPVKGVAFSITLPPYLSFASPDVPGCSYTKQDGVDVANCTTGLEVAPGGSISFADAHGDIAPTRVKLAANAPGPAVLVPGIVSGYGLAEVTPDPGAVHSLAQAPGYKVLSAADAAKVKTAQGAGDADPHDNVALFSAYTGSNPADLSVSAAPAQGHVGDTVTVTVTVANAGPSDVLASKVEVTAPTGTEFTSVDAACTAVTAGKTYTCALGPVAAGRTDSRRFESKIVSATVTDGKAVVSSAVKDKKPDNNTTAIKVTVLTGSGGTGGGSGLPITGANVGLIGGLGLGAIAIGAVLLVLTRRRREVVVPPTD
jgi:uncharacterized repeat protein (TIGR01451 family)